MCRVGGTSGDAIVECDVKWIVVLYGISGNHDLNALTFEANVPVASFGLKAKGLGIPAENAPVGKITASESRSYVLKVRQYDSHGMGT